ncbi:MAG TPA: hypothetical protein VHS96_11830, partial [Bacteroidia bacterium]|nr:hypothetical protein [Bacteroidia bacterium]
MESYLPILHSLSALGVRFAVIGTWALRAYFPTEMKDYQLHDCDLVLDPAGENILEAIRILDEKGWNVTSWDEPVHADVEGSLLSGRFYLRARKADR